MNCEEIRLWLERDLDGMAEPSVEVVTHLERCQVCAALAGRHKAITEAARAALPDGEVPARFAEAVLDAVAPATAQRAIVEAARSRFSRWSVLVPVVGVLCLTILLWPRAKPGPPPYPVLRNGHWEESKTVPAGVLFGLPENRAVELGPMQIRALRTSLLKSEITPELVAGQILVRSSRAGVIDTPLGKLRIDANTECIATLKTEETDMGIITFDKLRTIVPTALVVTVLSGHAVVHADDGDKIEGVAGRPIVVGKDGKKDLGKNLRVTLQVENESVASVLELLGQQVGRRVHVPADLKNTISLHVNDIAWARVMSILTEPNELDWKVREDGAIVVFRKRAMGGLQPPSKLDTLLARAVQGDQNAIAELDAILKRIHAALAKARGQGSAQRKIEPSRSPRFPNPDVFAARKAELETALAASRREIATTRAEVAELLRRLAVAELTLGQREARRTNLAAIILEFLQKTQAEMDQAKLDGHDQAAKDAQSRNVAAKVALDIMANISAGKQQIDALQQAKRMAEAERVAKDLAAQQAQLAEILQELGIDRPQK